ncbi:sorbin and SH3 domain-containing protein 1 isoform X7 [Bactrocera tryoni]|uniref:sorbin and SH3 domain-containing protein 1 isoform X7 n=1 Tax=Bactrocera tryoni TaxID=59916 RepID=UPI001A97776C|nr:sorbin and SH3 domain-containing protein 1 isoform X7 [Bactrocera tryoni]
MQCHNETTRPLTQYTRIGKFSYQATQNGFPLPPSTVATNRRYHLNAEQPQHYGRATNLNNHIISSSNITPAIPTSTTPSRLHQSCHDLRALQEPLTAAPRALAGKVPAFQRVETPVGASNNATTDGSATLATHRWSRQRSSDSCNIANCGKILWVSRETVGVPVDNDYEAARTFAASKGYYYDREQNVRIRTNAKGLPYTPLPERKQDFLANQRAIEAVVPLVFNRRRQSKSPNRYLESDVNIHFKTPIRHEYKQAMSDEDLAQRQAEQMQKLYQEERRRKYLQELQDMNARRHTDNFTPTQKSPIPLNRYDDFQSDLAPKSPNAITTRTAARALYNFQGQNARELTFKKGDIIYIRRQIDRNWYEGEFNAMIGLLPVSYVEVVNKETARQQPKKPSEGQARAKYNFQAQSGIELSLNKGELVTLTRRVDDNWFEGKIANRKGIFPVSYVEVLTDIGAEDIAARTVITEQASVTNLRPSLDTLRTNINNEFNLITKNGHQPPNGILKETKHHNNKIDALHVDTHSEPLVYRALYKYRPQNSDEMELLEGDIVHVLEICDDGWFVGTSQRTGCFGTFPGNYVERVR